MTTPPESPFPWPEDRIAHYTAHRVLEPLTIDGRLDEPSWRLAPRSPRFVDLITGRPTIHDTRAAVLWDDTYLYVGFWVEEPFVAATLTERDAPIWSENDVELFIAGRDAYYEFEINALGTIYEAFFVWEDAYANGFGTAPEFSRSVDGFKPWNGVGFDKQALLSGQPSEHNVGLYGMIERTELAGGRLHIRTRPGRGVALRAVL